MLTLLLAAVAAVAPPSGKALRLADAAADFAEALQHNDAGALERRLRPDWIIIDADGRSISRERFLSVIRSGELKHQSLHSVEVRTNIIGSMATQTMRTRGSGVYAGQSFTFDERATDVWVFEDGGWRCALTQLTRIVK